MISGGNETTPKTGHIHNEATSVDNPANQALLDNILGVK